MTSYQDAVAIDPSAPTSMCAPFSIFAFLHEDDGTFSPQVRNSQGQPIWEAAHQRYINPLFAEAVAACQRDRLLLRHKRGGE